MKNELPYLVEWIEFHKVVGFSHLVIYDDGSQDNAALIERLYKQHGRDYVSYEANVWHDDARLRRINAGGECLKKYKHLADWIIHLDIDEFTWSPKYSNLRDYFQTEVPSHTHILYVGATRFGWEHMRHRHTYSLQEVKDSGGNVSVKLTNPHGVQLVTQTHFHRAPDKRFTEPEELLKESNEKCARWKKQVGRLSPCMNDADEIYGKTFIRAAYAEGLWTHGGSVKLEDFSWHQIGDGRHIGDEPGSCAPPICDRSDPATLHIYHFRSPSLDDDIKKNQDWHWNANPEEDFAMDGEVYDKATWFFNIIWDASLLRFGDALRERVALLLSP
ncbi:hypothetical protein WJX84_010906 [Apatococcus fuscideae]|uniref:Glycosyltransferase family 92 protein n=1 Tax=Apatococcus fuscideae TaxID=2026836 RepID=A0AAW1SNW7_9CHLO